MPMSEPPQPPDLWGLIIALVIAAASGTVSIAHRILKGQRASCLWLFTEYLTAILCGYLAYQAYPILAPSLPPWATMPIVVAAAAHSGGRFFQKLEEVLINYKPPFSNK